MSLTTITTRPRVDSLRQPSSALDWLSARSWIDARNARVKQMTAGFEWCRVTQKGRKHRLKLKPHADGLLTAEPACKTGYYGESAERVRPVSALAEGKFCARKACVHDTPGRRAPRLQPVSRPRQLELELSPAEI